MKVVILAGGRGTRISEETETIPKPMVEIGGKPILWHIMKLYSHYGFNDFVICLGYLGYVIKEYFSHYYLHMSDMTIDMAHNRTTIHSTVSEPWKVTLVDTGLDTLTGGRIKRVEKYVNNERFMLTYGDGVSNVNIQDLLAYHDKNGVLATMTAVQPAGRFGSIDLGAKDNIIKSFLEKPKGDNNWINAGFFVLEPGVFRYIRDDSSIWERDPLENIAKDGNLYAYKHDGFWKPMDTLRDKIELENLWSGGKAPWKTWE